MKARFLDGPYKGIRLHVDKKHEFLILPLIVNVPDHLNIEGVEPLGYQVLYNKTKGDDFEGEFKFDGMRPA